MRLLTAGALLCLALLARPTPAAAFVLAEDELEELSTELGIGVRTFSFVLAGPTLRTPYALQDANPTALGLFDLRATFAHRRPWLKVVLHAQLAGMIRAHGAGALSLGRGAEPPRWIPLQTNLGDTDTFTLRAAVDWAYASITRGPLTVTAGRQPITFGRGKLWKPMDLLSTFSLTEVDSEYKPGVDALRLEWVPSDRAVVTLVAAAGEWNDRPSAAEELTGLTGLDRAISLRGSAFAARGKLGWSRGEAGLYAGYVRQDVVLGADAVYDAGAFDVYSEITVTVVTDESLSPRRPFTGRAVVRALAGATIKPAKKLTLIPEVYYNGFGAWDRADYLTLAVSERATLGELSNLGALYLGTSLMWEVHPLVNLNLATILNLRDPSGLLYLGMSYSLASNMSLVAGSYIPVGRVPDLRRQTSYGVISVPTPRSEFGLYPYFFFLELKAAM